MTKDPTSDGKRTHTLNDHAFGAGLGHIHPAGEVHDHDHDADDSLLESDSQQLSRVELISIGVDIGSSGTQIAFSRLFMHGPGEPLMMRRHVRSRETIYLSPVVLTPFLDNDEIDVKRLRGSISRAFQAAGLTADDIQTGAVIMTGAAASRKNAAAIVAALASETGDIVAAAAGHHMEASLAAYGSGAVERSRAGMKRILNIDIGGATTKLAVAENGRIVATASMKIGGRQVAFDRQNRIMRLEEAASTHARRCGFHWSKGQIASTGECEKVAERMAEDIFVALASEHAGIDGTAQFLTAPLTIAGLDGVMFSGGVAEYVYGRETRDFGDLGKSLGSAIKKRIGRGDLPAPLLPAGECIRATVLGCSEYSVQMSGSTACITSHAALLPRRNLRVLQPAFEFTADIDSDALADAIKQHRATLGDDDPSQDIAFAFRWRGDAEHGRVLAFARGVAAGLADRIATGARLYLLIEGDAALTLGAILRQELAISNEILVLDGIALRDFDYVDIGRLRMPSGMVPVTIKSLLFAKANS